MKRFALFIFAICLTGCSAGFESSPSVNIIDGIEEHDYSDNWSYDNNYHWHQALDSNVIKDKEKHVFSEWEVYNSNTNVRKCEICGFKEYAYDEKKHEHVFAEVYSFDENMHWKESICGCNELVSEIAEHNIVEQIVIQASFEHEGLIQYSCSECNYSYEMNTPIQEHSYNWSEWIYDDDAHYHLCLDEGYENLKADYEYHTYGKWIVNRNPTESEKGKEYRMCSICGYKEWNDIGFVSHHHTFSSSLSHDDTHHWYQATCNHDVVSDYYKHEYHEEIIESPTYEKEGTIQYTCKECGYSYINNPPVLVHSYSIYWSYNTEAHYHSCIDEGYEALSADYGKHTFNEMIIDNGDNSKRIFLYCTVCGYNKIEVTAN